MAKTGSFESCSAILAGLAKRLGLESRLLEVRLQHHWTDIVGEPIASQTWPAHIRFRKLLLIVRNSIWLHQLTYLKPALLAKLRPLAGPELIAEIVFRIGEIPSPPTIPPAACFTDGPSSGRETEAELLTAGIRDPELRERFTAAILRYPARQAPLPQAKDPSHAP